jgi:Cu(I)/Ag(I) efflux system periplasmic protein CusF
MNFLTRTAAAIAATALAFSALAADLTNAQVRKVDKENKKLTLTHEHIKNLDMPPMTMVFGVKDAKLLDKVKAGDKVKFAAIDEGGGKLVVTAIEAQK